jgi:hypothetical protein
VIYSAVRIPWEGNDGKISIRDLARVEDFLDGINDPRRTEYGNIRHKLAGIIVIAFTAALCGYEDYEKWRNSGG